MLILVEFIWNTYLEPPFSKNVFFVPFNKDGASGFVNHSDCWIDGYFLFVPTFPPPSALLASFINSLRPSDAYMRQ